MGHSISVRCEGWRAPRRWTNSGWRWISGASAGPPRIGSPFANGEQVSRGAMSAAHPVGVAWFGRPLGDGRR